MTARVDAARWRPWACSTGLHGALLLALAGGVVLTRLEPPADTALAIEAVVVDAATLAALQRRPVSPPEPMPAPVAVPRPEPVPPTPSQKAAPAERPAPPPAAKLQPKPQARPQAVVKAAPAPASAVAPAPTPAPVAPAIDPARAAAEAELQAQLAEEARLGALRASGLAARWSAAIRARIERAWIRPDSARPGLDCTVAVTQAPGGTVLKVVVRDCNGDEAVRQSIEDAVLRASPLPPPPDPALFERELILRFRPDA